MFGSQALETAIGLALMFFVLATAASAVVEIGAKIFKTRARGLERAIARLVDGSDQTKKQRVARVQTLVKTATGRTRSAYLSATAFADAVTQLAATVEVPKSLKTKLNVLAREARGDLTQVKAGLESWFDQAMTTAGETYKKMTSLILLGVGFVLAVALNASAVDVAQDLWSDPVKREALAAQAAQVATDPQAAAELGCTDDDASEGSAEETDVVDSINHASCVLDKVDGFALPIGWGASEPKTGWWWARHLAGWIVTALLVMLGAPFWFDLLTRLVALRGGGQQPKSASDDDTSNSVMAASPALLQSRRETQQQIAEVRREAGGEEADWLTIALNLAPPPEQQRTPD